MLKGNGDPVLSSQSLKALLGIRELVYNGTMRPGERMSELALVDRLGLSRTPVRAALARLELEGLLEALPSGGYAVRAFSDADVSDAIELRGVLEGTAARLAAERGVAPSVMREAQDLLAQLANTLDGKGGLQQFETYMRLNEDFHELLAKMSGSVMLQRELERLAVLPFASPSAFVDAHAAMPGFEDVLAVAHNHHRALIEAIENREGARAEALGREHARLARRTLDRVLESAELRSRVPGLALLADDGQRDNEGTED
ncbi:MAG: GntR family transcriptional regulator [Hyphomicrobiales bacterium]|nr:MAG: GntR family transcriptional regulator [Hyphomicrobiales bacterium]